MKFLDYTDISERTNALFDEVSAAEERCEKAILAGDPPDLNEYRHLCGLSHLLLGLVAMCDAARAIDDIHRQRNGRH